MVMMVIILIHQTQVSMEMQAQERQIQTEYMVSPN